MATREELKRQSKEETKDDDQAEAATKTDNVEVAKIQVTNDSLQPVCEQNSIAEQSAAEVPDIGLIRPAEQARLEDSPSAIRIENQSELTKVLSA